VSVARQALVAQICATGFNSTRPLPGYAAVTTSWQSQSTSATATLSTAATLPEPGSAGTRSVIRTHRRHHRFCGSLTAAEYSAVSAVLPRPSLVHRVARCAPPGDRSVAPDSQVHSSYAESADLPQSLQVCVTLQCRGCAPDTHILAGQPRLDALDSAAHRCKKRSQERLRTLVMWG
jgi:hypothetical protein